MICASRRCDIASNGLKRISAPVPSWIAGIVLPRAVDVDPTALNAGVLTHCLSAAMGRGVGSQPTN